MSVRSSRFAMFGMARLAALVVALAASILPAGAEPSHGLSAFGALKYAPDFANFAYVNPDAPKGGRIAMIGTSSLTTFDSFNPFILKGDAAQGLSFLFDSLMTRAADEPDAMYGLVAESVDVAADRLGVTFKLRPAARFADGTPVTAADIVFSFTTLRDKGHPVFRIQLRDVTGVEAVDAATVRYTFKGTQVRNLPLVVAGLPILSKAYYTTQPFEQTTLETPLGSGPYTIGEHKQGTFVAYRRREDYWAKDLPVNRGRFNFGELRYEYYRDRNAELQNLKAGLFDLREEFTSKDWATAYDIPAVTDGRLQRLTLPDQRPSGAQGFFINTRQTKFADPRVRRALDQAFDFEWTNKNLFYGLYTRTASYFENSDMKAAGLPSADELALLEPFKKDLPPAVFGEVYTPPISDGSGSDRRLLREAQKLFNEAGWETRMERDDDPECGMFCRAMIGAGIKTAKMHTTLRNGRGELFEIEFLIRDPTSERILTPYVEKLRALGVTANIRRVDSAQYERRVKSFDFDIVTSRFVMPLTPGAEMRNYLGSEAARTDGTLNLAGIQSPVVDALITHILEAKDRPALVTAARALDRVLRAGHYWVPHWYKASHHIAYWDKFARPAQKPAFDPGVLDTWWYDAEKAAKLKTN